MLIPVDLMSVVSTGSSSANSRGAGNSDAGQAGSWLLAADTSASEKSGKDIINQIFMSYASDGEADPAARFATDLKALLSAHGVALEDAQNLFPPATDLAAGHQSGEQGESAWSVDELLQMSMSPISGGNNLPLSDQTLPSVLSNWLAALAEPAGATGSESARNPSALLLGGSADSGSASAAQLSKVASAVAEGAAAKSAGTLVQGQASDLVIAGGTDALAGSARTGLTGVNTKGEAETDALLSPINVRNPETGAAGASPDQTLRTSLPADVTRQIAESLQVNPGSQKITSDAANTSAFRSIQFNAPGSGDSADATESRPANQPDLIRAGAPLERNQAIASQLTASLVSGVNADNAGTTSATQLMNPADGSTVTSRAEQRMFATESAQQAQSQSAQQTATRTAEGLPRFAMDTAFGQQGWSDSLGRQLLVMSSQGVSSAQIRLDPPELGSLTVKIQMSADQQTSVSFVSQHAMVREALEQQLNRLQDLFREQGLDLQDVSVSDQSAQQREGEAGGQQKQNGSQDQGSGEQGPADAAPVMVRSESLIDFYA